MSQAEQETGFSPFLAPVLEIEAPSCVSPKIVIVIFICESELVKSPPINSKLNFS